MNNINKNIILTYARAIRTIQRDQIDPYIENIKVEIKKEFPSLTDEQATDWSYDVINCETNQEVVYTLNRLADIVKEQDRSKWVCQYCGKNTYDIDIDYVYGTDHLACVMEHDIKNREHSDPDYILNKDKAVISNIENQINNILTELNALKKKFEDDGK